MRTAKLKRPKLEWLQTKQFAMRNKQWLRILYVLYDPAGMVLLDMIQSHTGKVALTMSHSRAGKRFKEQLDFPVMKDDAGLQFHAGVFLDKCIRKATWES